MPSYGMGGGQMNAIYGLGRRRVPYRAFIESQIPSLYTRKKYQEEKDIAEQQLALDTEALNLSERELEEGTRQANARLALQREQMNEEAKQAKKSQAIQLGQTGVLGGYIADKAGLIDKAKPMFGLGKSATKTSALKSTPVVSPTPTTSVATTAGLSDAAVKSGLVGTGSLSATEAGLTATEAEAMGIAHTPAAEYSVTGPGASSLAYSAPFAAVALGGYLGMQNSLKRKSNVGVRDFLSAYYSGTPANTRIGNQYTPLDAQWQNPDFVKNFVFSGRPVSDEFVKGVMNKSIPFEDVLKEVQRLQKSEYDEMSAMTGGGS